MAPYTYYYFFSIALLYGALFWIGSMLFFRLTHRTITGEELKPHTDGYERMRKKSSLKSLAIPFALLVVFILNLTLSISLVMRLQENERYADDVPVLLISAPIVGFIFFAGVVIYLLRNTKLISR